MPLVGARAELRTCPLCDRCDGLHGDRLQIQVARALCNGGIDAGHALARMMIDDAHLCDRIVFVQVPGEAGATITIPDPPQRWQVACARAVARDELPEIGLVVQVILARYIPGKCSRQTLDAIAAELTEALAFLDPSIMSVDVDSKRDELDPAHLIIKINATTPTLGAVTEMPHDVEIPDDIMLRARGQA